MRWSQIAIPAPTLPLSCLTLADEEVGRLRDDRADRHVLSECTQVTLRRPSALVGQDSIKKPRPGRSVRLGVCLCAFLAASPLAAHSYAQGKLDHEDAPPLGSEDVARTIPYSITQVLDAAKLAMAAYDCEVKKETPNLLECTRSRHVGVFVGSGGEKVTARLTPKGDGTHVEVKTGKGFVGRLGKRNWSTAIFDEALKNLQRQ